MQVGGQLFMVWTLGEEQARHRSYYSYSFEPRGDCPIRLYQRGKSFKLCPLCGLEAKEHTAVRREEKGFYYAICPKRVPA